MKYIVRMDDDRAGHFWWVRIGYKIKSGVQKTFQDSRYGGSTRAYQAAVKWRNKELKRMLPIMKEEYGYDANSQRYWGEGVSEVLDKKTSGNVYVRIMAHYYDGKNKKQVKKSWGVDKWGYDEAWKLATEWREAKLNGK